MSYLLVSSLFLILANLPFGLTGGQAQSSNVLPGWEKAGACQIRFLIPKDLKNQHVKGIDSCFAEFRSDKMRLAIDAGWFGDGTFAKTEAMLEFTEESVVIDGKKVQLITYRDGQTKSKRKFFARLFVTLHEGKSRNTDPSVFLFMTVEAKSERELEIANQIFHSITFEPYRPFLIEW